MIYLNGEFIPGDQARIDISDRGFTLGDGLFETMRAYQGKVFKLVEHLERLENGAREVGIPFPVEKEILARVVRDLLEKNHLLKSDASLRITLTRGPGLRGIVPPRNPRPTLLVTSAPIPGGMPRPVSALICSVRRNEGSPTCRLKTLNYLDSILARREAMGAGHDEGLLLNSKGNVVEASAANLFIVRNQELLTPPVLDGALPGITRQVVIQLAEQGGITCREQSIDPRDLFSAREAFLTNSLVEICPLAEVNGSPIGKGEPGDITRRLQAAYRALTASLLNGA